MDQLGRPAHGHGHGGRDADGNDVEDFALDFLDGRLRLFLGESGRWRAGLTVAKMKDCRWLKPILVAQIEFLEWTGENYLRHTKFIALRDDKPAREVRCE